MCHSHVSWYVVGAQCVVVFCTLLLFVWNIHASYFMSVVCQACSGVISVAFYDYECFRGFGLISITAGAMVATVAGLRSSPVVYDYQVLVAPPVIFSVRPLRGPTVGGTVLEVGGSGLGTEATVLLIARDAAGMPTGVRLECRWRGVPGMSCTNAAILCVSPPSDGIADSYDIVVETDGLVSRFLGGVWSYDAPVIASVQPRVLAACPPHGANLTVAGANFGVVPGVVTVGGVPTVCHDWSDNTVTCVAPAGALRAPLCVIAASGKASPAVSISYVAPVVTGVSVILAPTRGGMTVEVAGAGFGVPSLSVAVWLVQSQGIQNNGSLGRAPWDISGSQQCHLTRCRSALVPCGREPGWAGQ